MSAVTRPIPLDSEVIAVDQDRLERQGRLVGSHDNIDVWARPLSGHAYAVAIVNRGDTAVKFRPDFPALGLAGRFRARDLWRHTSLGVLSPRYAAHVQPRGVVMLKLTPSPRGPRQPPRA